MLTLRGSLDPFYAASRLIAWGFLPNYSCSGPEFCPKSENMGWRYVWYTSGALVFVLSILRVTVINLKETPKYLLGQGRDDEVVETLQWLATKHNRPCSLSLAQLEACGEIVTSRAATGKGGKKINFSFADIWVHVRGLFLTRKLAISTLLLWFSWLLIGLAYPLYVRLTMCAHAQAGNLRMLICHAVECFPSNISRDEVSSLPARFEQVLWLRCRSR